MRVLITGGSGFAGSWLADGCRRAGDEVVALSSADADLLDPAAARAAVAAQPLDVVAVRVEDDHAAQLPGERGRGDAADGAAADHEHRRVDHASPSSSASSRPSAA